MSASDLRRGPGWWMDLDGDWNPPELWPESTPPLPGWNRTDDGSWVAPVEKSSDNEPDPGESSAEAPLTPTVPDARRPIGYAEYVSPAAPQERYQPSIEAALGAAAAAAITAATIAIGLILLLMVL